MEELQEIGLARQEHYPWWNVEDSTGKLLMTYLASVISIMDGRKPITDKVSFIPTNEFNPDEDKNELRNRLLNDVLPLPRKIKVGELENIKSKYGTELKRFRNNIEKILIELNRFEGTKDFEDYYKLEIEEINDTKKFIAGKLEEPRFGKIVFGTLSGLMAAGITVAQTPKEQMMLTIPSILNAIYNAVENHRRSDILEREPLSYLALVEKRLKK